MVVNRGKILLIDDDAESLRVLCEVLSRGGYDVACAENGYDAIQIIHTSVISLVISDYNLPDTTGPELIQQMRQVCPNLLAIIVSANRGLHVRLEAFEAGVYTFIAKPVNLPQILRSVSQALSSKQNKIHVKKSFFFRWTRTIKLK
ncbi:hypothetical protein CMK22_13150 [Candidatus Poribacteria bacterium]|nr:hypothetical protein [Candidatus Poribacteria bacterium]